MTREITILGYHVVAWQAAATLAAAVVGLVLLVKLKRLIRRLDANWDATPAVKAAAVVALMATGVSMDTNWGFFGTYLHVANPVLRSFLFADVECALFVMALQARENKLRDGKQGVQGSLVWVLSGIAMLPAWIEAGPLEGTVRALAGPFLAALLWHFALGLEFKREKPKGGEDNALTQVLKHWREGLLARLGVVAPNRSALEIREDLAMDNAVRLADRLEWLNSPEAGRWARRSRKKVKRQLRDAVRLSGAAAVPARKRMLLEQLAVVQHAEELATLKLPSPWVLDEPAAPAVTSASAPALPAAPVADTQVSPQPVQAAEVAQQPVSVLAAEIADTQVGYAYPQQAGYTSNTQAGYAAVPDLDTRIPAYPSTRGNAYPQDRGHTGGRGLLSQVPAQPVHAGPPTAPTPAPVAPAQMAGPANGHSVERGHGHAAVALLEPEVQTDQLGASMLFDGAGYAAGPEFEMHTPQAPDTAVNSVSALQSDTAIGYAADTRIRVYPSADENAYPQDGGHAGDTQVGYAADTQDQTVSEGGEELPWSAETGALARAIVAERQASGEPVSARWFLPAFRGRKGSISQKYANALYRYALAPELPAANDVVDENETAG
jgi:hypothetical protein